MALAADVNAFVSQHEPWKVAKTDPAAALGILSVAYDAVCDLNVLFTPFLPHGAQRVWDNLGVAVRVPLPEVAEAGEGDDRHRVIRTHGDWQPWAPVRVAPGTPVGEQSPLFTKIDPEAVDAELARLAG
jgi:methionyl-tRNA synthetase